MFACASFLRAFRCPRRRTNNLVPEPKTIQRLGLAILGLAAMGPVKVVLITGCGSGLGKALARAFQKQVVFAGKPSTFRVYASDLTLASVEDLQLEGLQVLALDVTSAENVQRAVNHVEQEAGRIDILVCNAGVVTIAPLIEEKLSEIQAVWNVNT